MATSQSDAGGTVGNPFDQFEASPTEGKVAANPFDQFEPEHVQPVKAVEPKVPVEEKGIIQQIEHARSLVRGIVGSAEAAASFLSQSLLFIPSGLAAAASPLVGRTPTEGMQAVNSLTYEPHTTWGKDTNDVINKPFQLLAEGGEMAGDKVMNVTDSVLLATAVSTAIQALPMALGVKAGRMGKAKVAAQEALVKGAPLEEAVGKGLEEAGASEKEVNQAKGDVREQNEERLKVLGEKDTLTATEANEYLSRKKQPSSKIVPQGVDIPTAMKQKAFETITTKDGREVYLIHQEAGEGGRKITAVNNLGKKVGSLEYSTKEDAEGVRLNPDVSVSPEWQRQGIASKMYDLAEKEGAKIPSADEQGEFRTEAGAAFRAARETRRPLPGELTNSIAPKSAQPAANSEAISKAIEAGDSGFVQQMKLTPDNLSDSLFKLNNLRQDAKLEALKKLEQVPKDYAKVAEEIYGSFEEKPEQMSPRAAALKKELVDPVMTENAKLYADISKIDPALLEGEDYVTRRAKGKPSIFESLSGNVPGGGTLSRSAPSLKSRVYFKARSGDGAEALVSVKDGKVSAWKEGKASELGSVEGEGKVGKTFKGAEGKEWKLENASTREIEAQTPTRYYKDALGTAIDNNVRLKDAYRNIQFLEGLKSNPEFEHFATKVESGVPKGWREVPGIPSFRGYAFEPHLAEVLSDAVGDKGLSALDGLARVSRVMTGSLFWNPLPHILNVADHWVVGKGASSWVNPLSYPKLLKTSLEAFREVSTQGPKYRQMLREGAAFMYPNKLLEGFTNQVMEKLGQDPQMNGVAKGFGYEGAKAMVDKLWRSTGGKIYDFSGRQMWKWNDVMMMQAFLEKEGKGASHADIIRDVEKHIPNYRVRSRVLMDNAGGRTFSQLLQHPAVAAFGRYDYGRMRSYGEMIRDAVGKDRTLRDRAKAVDQMVMIGLMGSVVYPLLGDRVAQWLTGNSNASANRFGSGTIPSLMWKWMQGEKGMNQVFQSSFPMAPATKTALQVGFNRDLFTGKEFAANPKELTQRILEQLSPVDAATRLSEGKKSPEQFLAEQVGIKIPSSAQLKAQTTQQRKRTLQELRKNLGMDIMKAEMKRTRKQIKGE